MRGDQKGFKEGRIVKSDCVIPTSQNHANIQHDLTALAEQYAREGKKEILHVHGISRTTTQLCHGLDKAFEILRLQVHDQARSAVNLTTP